ncbi:hypothetical protein L596_017885 [Steinernema carpocapsae]|uniref:Uncharacterized protein n=1 Tax=Steinernema carpocapsae TaxID=34508 RepID=A0A4U5N3D3_STECR|nr:hypothetical protein L596_017885 [Steinernema carpocapsae]
MNTLVPNQLRDLIDILPYDLLKKIQEIASENAVWSDLIEEKLDLYKTLDICVIHHPDHPDGGLKISLELCGAAENHVTSQEHPKPYSHLRFVHICGSAEQSNSSRSGRNLRVFGRPAAAPIQGPAGTLKSRRALRNVDQVKPLQDPSLVWTYLTLPVHKKDEKNKPKLVIENMSESNQAFMDQLSGYLNWKFPIIEMTRIHSFPQFIANFIQNEALATTLRTLKISQCDLTEAFYESIQCLFLQGRIQELLVEMCLLKPEEEFFLDLVQLWLELSSCTKKDASNQKAIFEVEDGKGIFNRLKCKFDPEFENADEQPIVVKNKEDSVLRMHGGKDNAIILEVIRIHPK